MTGFIFIMISAFCHSLWNILLKRSSDKYSFNLFMHLVNLIFFTLMYPIFFRDYMYLDLRALMYGIIGALFFSLYHLLLSTAYRYSDVSSIYPVTTSSPLFIIIWATLFMGEQLTLFGILGIGVTVFGGIVLNGLDKLTQRPNKGMLFALGAAFAYSFGALADKAGVGTSNTVFYVYCLCFFMSLDLSIYGLRQKSFKMDFLRKEYKTVILAGIIVFFSFMSYRVGLAYMEVSYASALRQVNALFALMMGVLIFKEALTANKLIGTVIIVGGVVLIKFGM